MLKKSHHFLMLWPWPLTYDLEKLIRSGHYHYQCVYQIWEQSIQWFLSYRVNTIAGGGRRVAGGGRLRRKTITIINAYPSRCNADFKARCIFFKEISNKFSSDSRHHSQWLTRFKITFLGCWWQNAARSQGISSHGFNLVSRNIPVTGGFPSQKASIVEVTLMLARRSCWINNGNAGDL